MKRRCWRKSRQRDLRRWLDGDSYRDGQHASVAVDPPWGTELASEALDGITFHDPLEVRFVHAFRKYGVSQQTIRVASQRARELFDTDYPFTSHQFRTDGRTIFASAREATGKTELLDLVRQQFAFRRISMLPSHAKSSKSAWVIRSLAFLPRQARTVSRSFQQAHSPPRPP